MSYEDKEKNHSYLISSRFCVLSAILNFNTRSSKLEVWDGRKIRKY